MVRELTALASVLALLGCSRGEERPAPPSRAAAPAVKLAGSEVYRIDAEPPAPCAVGATCEVALRLTALGTYKVNKEYPFKFLAAPSAELAVDGVGAFAHEATQVGSMRVRFRATAAGTTELAGVFKLSVCNEATCEIEEPRIALAVQVR